MTQVTRLGDVTNHGGPIITGSSDVITNGLPTGRITDIHDCPIPSHDPNPLVAPPASTVIVNGLIISTITTVSACGGALATGSSNVIANEGAFPSYAVIEPGVILIGGNKIFDNTVEGQKAVDIAEEKIMPGLSTEKSGGAPTGVTPEYYDCNRFPDIITVNNLSTPVSKHFMLSHCGGIPAAQRGLTAKQIACNWASLCLAILDPVYEVFKFNINSGWRSVAGGKGNTDHGLGLAADLSAGSIVKGIEMFKWIVKSNLPFTQVIYERNGTTGIGWVHVSFNTAPRGNARTMWTYNNGVTFSHGGQNGQNLPPELMP